MPRARLSGMGLCAVPNGLTHGLSTPAATRCAAHEATGHSISTTASPQHHLHNTISSTPRSRSEFTSGSCARIVATRCGFRGSMVGGPATALRRPVQSGQCNPDRSERFPPEGKPGEELHLTSGRRVARAGISLGEIDALLPADTSAGRHRSALQVDPANDPRQDSLRPLGLQQFVPATRGFGGGDWVRPFRGKPVFPGEPCAGVCTVR